MNGTSGFQEVRSSTSRLPSYRFLHKQRHRFGTGAGTCFRLNTIILIGLAFCSCSTEVKFSLIELNKPIEGVVYHLPATEIPITATYQIEKCGAQPQIQIIAIGLNDNVVADHDPSATYMLDHNKLTNWLKMIESAKIELYPAGTLKSVTYKAQDQTREVIKEAAGAARNIALAASGLPPMPVTMLQAGTPISEYCNVTTTEALRRKEDIESKVKELKAKLDQQFATFVSSPDESTGITIDLIQGQLDKAIQRLAAIKTGQLQVSFSLNFFPRHSMLSTEMVPSPYLFFKWFDDNVIKYPSNVEKSLKMNIALMRSGRGTFSSCPVTENQGILYRMPDYYTMTIEHNDRKAHVSEMPILQLGCLARFEVKNRIFQKNSHEITFTGTGNLETFHFAETAVRAQQLIGTIGDTASQAGNFELQKLTQQSELEKQKKGLADAERERIKAERELAEERAKQQ